MISMLIRDDCKTFDHSCSFDSGLSPLVWTFVSPAQIQTHIETWQNGFWHDLANIKTAANIKILASDFYIWILPFELFFFFFFYLSFIFQMWPSSYSSRVNSERFTSKLYSHTSQSHPHIQLWWSWEVSEWNFCADMWRRRTME